MVPINELDAFLKPINLDTSSIWKNLGKAAHSPKLARTVESKAYMKSFDLGLKSGLEGTYSLCFCDGCVDDSALVQLVVQAVFDMGFRLGQHLRPRVKDEFFTSTATSYVLQEIMNYAGKRTTIAEEYCGIPIATTIQ